ncbi:proline iminopeptidase-family hydrolase [Sphingobium sp. BHU LFT2]|uniref:proline iminopeptidase-family hydrolase n=1 Tax=Sphingobium sp. BHU LFT2 TaxID=2807634 RepID=UPI001BE78002|nr:proline iminopeptidase-family hydrolase [Sphingobium sp. BHU LFT2]MBT2246279.1 proline iminopeptidase-family hydrolase [Sphingobium sp. BHU LFT2]
MQFARRSVIAGGAASLLMPSVLKASGEGTSEGFATLSRGRVWWRRVGSSDRTPLLVLHGGPGAGHDYLEPLADLARVRPVIFYDQLGCGRSDKPEDQSLWTMDYFVREIDELRDVLDLREVLLFGHSYGGWLAQEYMRSGKNARSVRSLILASPSGSVAEFADGAARLLGRLPGNLDQRRRELESSGQTASPAYQNIVQKFYDAFLVHVDQPPEYLLRTFENIASSRNYGVMNGPSEFSVTGNLQTWDGRGSLSSISVPTLVLTSEWDEVTLDCHERLHAAIKRSVLRVIPKARHLAMVEKPAAYNEILGQFIEGRV